ncbi:MAG: hypothetical protein MUF71_06975 [Candidatus Kapabacteria bacterium]|jgi:hypothetical protein|nr:hypothetical protein [Candidatus Kapabacteria bacterium]
MPNNSHEHPEEKMPQSRIATALREYGNKAAFAPMFADRVQRRINAAPANNPAMQALTPLDALAQELVWMFRRVAIVGTSLVVLLAGYNLYTNDDVSFDAVFGLPNEAHSLSVESVLMPD